MKIAKRLKKKQASSNKKKKFCCVYSFSLKYPQANKTRPAYLIGKCHTISLT